MTAANVAQVSVIGFADHRIDGAHLLVARQGQHVTDQRVGHARHAGGGSQQDGRFDVAHFIHLGGAGQLSETIARENRTGHFFAVEIAGMRQNRGYAGPDVVAANNGGLSDFDTGNVGDRIKRTGRQDADFQTESGSAGAWSGSCLLGGSECGRRHEDRNSEKLSGHGPKHKTGFQSVAIS